MGFWAETGTIFKNVPVVSQNENSKRGFRAETSLVQFPKNVSVSQNENRKMGFRGETPLVQWCLGFSAHSRVDCRHERRPCGIWELGPKVCDWPSRAPFRTPRSTVNPEPGYSPGTGTRGSCADLLVRNKRNARKIFLKAFLALPCGRTSE